MTKAEAEAVFAQLREQAEAAQSDDEVRSITSRIAHITRTLRIERGIGLPTHPAAQAAELDEAYELRPHISFLSDKLTQAVRDVERGKNRMLAISMPPRMGKSTLVSQYTPLWMLRRHPEWKIVMASYDAGLTIQWARHIRWLIEKKPELGIALVPDGGAGGRWSTLEGGGMYATSVRGGLTGRGARVMIIDDPVKDFVEAHSLSMRSNQWDWWLSVAQTRLEPPYLVLVVMTRWHEDDFVGRIFSPDHEGDPRMWERISLSAIAEPGDVLGRDEGVPLLSPLLREDEDKALARWADVKTTVGSYTFAAMYQQRPAPARGAIFDSGWWRFWTTNPERETEDGRVVYVDPGEFTGGRWLDSWDCTFKGGIHSGDWVVAQRWVRHRANRYLVAQLRHRWSFLQTLDGMEQWATTDNHGISPWGHLVHERLVEDSANGPAIIDTMKNRIAGLKPIRPRSSKEARARAITPEIESGNVYLPHPSDPGNEWVQDLLSELRNFPSDVHDDQVDALTQALSALRDGGRGMATVPGSSSTPRSGVPAVNRRDVVAAARSDLSRRRRY